MTAHVRNLEGAERIDWSGQFNAAAYSSEKPQSNEMTFDDIAEEHTRQLSGNYVQNNRLAVFDEGRSADSNYDSEEEKKKRAWDQVMLSQQMALTTSNVIQFLGDSISYDQAWLNINKDYLEVKDDQMLRIKDGKRIEAKDDPEGKFIVKTEEEKQAYEDSIGGCTMYKAQDETTVVDGKRVDVKTFYNSLSLKEEITRKQDVIAKVEKGELKPEEIDQDLRKEVIDRAAGKEDPAIEPPQTVQQLSAALGIGQSRSVEPQQNIARAPSWTPGFSP